MSEYSWPLHAGTDKMPVGHLACSLQDVNAQNEQKNTPLHYACLLGHTEVCWLLEALMTGSPHIRPCTSAGLAPQVVQRLLANGADLSCLNR